MARPCTVCAHPQRLQIDADLVANVPIRVVAERYGLIRTSVARHKDSHARGGEVMLAEARREYGQIQERRANLNVAAELGTILERARLLAEACDRWLRDPLNEAQYDVGPRADECSVIFEEVDDNGRMVRRKERLSLLVDKIQNGLGVSVVRVETRHTDIRELVLKAQAGSLQAIETVTSLLERSFEMQSKLDAAAALQAMSPEECERELQRFFTEELELSPGAVDGLLKRVEACALREAEVAAALALAEDE